MKLRIRGDSIRIRVSQSEVGRILEAGVCEDRVRFAGGAALTYRVEVVPDGRLEARLAGSVLTLCVPRALVDGWAEPAEVSIAGSQPLAGGDSLALLLEKDFACLAPRAGEDESDLFPNPEAAAEGAGTPGSRV